MRTKSSVIAVAAVVASLVAGCAGAPREASSERTPDRSYIADADAHGYLTYDPEAMTLRGLTRDGTVRWQRDGVDPAEVHCVSTCPDAVVSFRAGPDGKGPESAAWALGDTWDRTAPDQDRNVVRIFWAESREKWIGATADNLVVASAGNRQVIPAANLSSTVSRISADGLHIALSTPADLGGSSWTGLTFTSAGTGVSPSGSIQGMPGPIGCWSDGSDSLITLGKNPSAISTTNPEIRQPIPVDFSSDCSSGSFGTAVGNYRSSTGGNVSKVSVVTPRNFHEMNTSGDLPNTSGFKAVGPCVAFVRSERLAFMNPASGSIRTTGTEALDIWRIGPDSAYLMTRSGRAATVSVSVDDCPSAT